jgi:peptidoglycan/xylan/chitin deacetylase (PgdA/CDA1 family)
VAGQGIKGENVPSRAFTWLIEDKLMPEQRRAPSRVYGTREGGREIILTFGDGSHPQHTPTLFDYLKAEGLRIVFFVLGQQVARPDRKAISERAYVLYDDILKTTVDHFPTVVQRARTIPQTRFIAQPSTLQGEHGNV